MAILAPVPRTVLAELIGEPVGIHRKHNPHHALVDKRGDRTINTIAVGKRVQKVECLRHRGMFVGVMQRINQHLRFPLIDRHVVADLGGVQLAALVAPTNGEDINDVWVCHLNRSNLTADLFVGLE